MKDAKRSLRERATDWAGTESAASRHLGIAGLNLAEEEGAEALLLAAGSLQWLAADLLWEQEGSVEAVVATLQRSGCLGRLSPERVGQRLREAGAASSISRRPGDWEADGARRRGVLAELRREGDALRAYYLEPAGRRARLLESGPTLTALLSHIDEEGLLGEDLVPWEPAGDREALRTLTAFELQEFEILPPALSMLEERTHRFESSLGGHLERHGILPAVRAALAFTPAIEQGMMPDEVRRFLMTFDTFGDDPPLRELAEALIHCRFRVLRHVEGAAPLVSLAPWVQYLRGPCAEFADSRDQSLREATNFAHYAFHFVNLMDLAGLPGEPCTEELRRALLCVEEELKEFALVGQRQGHSDQRADLSRFERARMMGQAPRALLVERLARLCGAWRRGHRTGPPGARPQLDHPLVDTARSVVENHPDQGAVDALNHALHTASVQHTEIFQTLSPGEVLEFLVCLLRVAQSNEGVDLSRPLTFHLAALPRPFPGVVLQERIQQLRGRLDDDVLYVDMLRDPDLQALCQLIATEDDPTLLGLLRERLKMQGARLAAPSAPAYSSERNTTENELAG